MFRVARSDFLECTCIFRSTFGHGIHKKLILKFQNMSLKTEQYHNIYNSMSIKTIQNSIKQEEPIDKPVIGNRESLSALIPRSKLYIFEQEGVKTKEIYRFGLSCFFCVRVGRTYCIHKKVPMRLFPHVGITFSCNARFLHVTKKILCSEDSCCCVCVFLIHLSPRKY